MTLSPTLLAIIMYKTEALRRVLVRKGLLTNEEVLDEIKMVRRKMEGKLENVEVGQNE